MDWPPYGLIKYQLKELNLIKGGQQSLSFFNLTDSLVLIEAQRERNRCRGYIFFSERRKSSPRTDTIWISTNWANKIVRAAILPKIIIIFSDAKVFFFQKQRIPICTVDYVRSAGKKILIIISRVCVQSASTCFCNCDSPPPSCQVDDEIKTFVPLPLFWRFKG